jgi:hypothetical protein
MMSNATLYGGARLSMLKNLTNATKEGDFGYIIANLTYGAENLNQSRLEVCSAALDVVEAQYPQNACGNDASSPIKCDERSFRGPEWRSDTATAQGSSRG